MPRQGITQAEILNGWKEIAKYLGMGVRTAQRYEHALGLPIRRPAGKPWGTVIATKGEIDAWISARPLREAFGLRPRAADTTEIVKRLDRQVTELKRQVTELHQLREESARLRHEMSASRQALDASIQLLHESLSLGAGESRSFSRRTADILTFDPKRNVN